MASSPENLSPVTYQTWLGHGAFGVVLKAVDPPRLATAVKFIFPPIDSNDSKDMTQIFRESTISSRLSPHPNIVEILGVSERKFSLSELESIFPDSILRNEDQQTMKDHFLGKARRQKKIYGVRIEMEL